MTNQFQTVHQYCIAVPPCCVGPVRTGALTSIDASRPRIERFADARLHHVGLVV